MQFASNNRQAWIWLVPLLLLTCWLGARGLDADLIKFDEYWSIYSAGGAHYGPLSARGIVQRLAEEDPRQTPLFFLMLAEWGSFTGWTPAANRALPLLTGLLAVAWLYRLGREIASPTVGLVAAGVLGASSFFLFYLHEIRGYTLYVLLTVVCLWSYWRMAYQEQKPGFFVRATLFLSVTGLLHTLYLAAAVVVSVGIYHLLFVPKSRQWWHTSALLAAGVVTFLPWSIVGLNAISRLNEIDSIFALDAGQVISGVLYNFSNGSVALLAVVAFYGLFARGRSIGFVVFCAASILMLSLAINLRLPLIIHIRYLLPLLPLIGLIVGFGAEQLATRGLSRVLVLAVWITAGVWNGLPIPYNDPHYDFLADKLAERGEAGDVMAYHGADFHWLQEPLLEYYMHGVEMDYVVMESLPGLEGSDTYEQAARSFIGDAPRVWLGINPRFPSNFRWEVFNDILAESYVDCGAVPGLPEDMNMGLALHVRNVADLPLHFGDGVRARLLESLSTSARDTLPVLLGWLVGEGVPASTYSMALHLDNSQGQFVAQADFGLPPAGFSCQSVELPVGQLPPGTYTLLLTVYDWDTGARLPGENDDTGDQRDRLVLGQMTISS